MKFCGSCGQQIPDNANACPYCGAFQDSAVPAAKAKKAFPVKAVLGIVLALAVLVGGFFAVRAIFGGGWEKPLKEAIDKAYAATEQIHFDNAFMRKDIGQRALKAL